MIILSASWFYLLFAILFGVLGTMSLKISDGFRHLKWIWLVALFYCLSFSALTLALQNLDISLVYAIWSGVGTLLVAVLSIFIFGERINARQWLALLVIILGVLGVHLSYA